MEPGIPRKVTSMLEQRSCPIGMGAPRKEDHHLSKDFWAEDRMGGAFSKETHAEEQRRHQHLWPQAQWQSGWWPVGYIYGLLRKYTVLHALGQTWNS